MDRGSENQPRVSENFNFLAQCSKFIYIFINFFKTLYPIKILHIINYIQVPFLLSTEKKKIYAACHLLSLQPVSYCPCSLSFIVSVISGHQPNFLLSFLLSATFSAMTCVCVTGVHIKFQIQVNCDFEA